MKIINISKNSILGTNINTANSFFSRLLGLIPKKELKSDEGLIISPCSSIHTCFMKIPIDVIFVDKHNIIVHQLKSINPWKLSKIIFHASFVVELPSGTIEKTCTEIGDHISIEK